MYGNTNYETTGSAATRVKLLYTSQEPLKYVNLSFVGPDLRSSPGECMMMGLLGFLIHDIDGVGMSKFLSNDQRYCYKYLCS